MFTIYTRISASRRYNKALIWKGSAEDGVIHARYDATANGLGRVVAAYVLDEDGHCVGVWNEYDGFRRHHPNKECRWTITLSGLEALDTVATLNDFA
jgi:hypothetical protein